MYYLENQELYHHGILGMKWGIRRYQPYPKGHVGGKEIGEAAKDKTFVRTKVKNVVTSEKFKTAAKVTAGIALGAVGATFITSPKGYALMKVGVSAINSAIKNISGKTTLREADGKTDTTRDILTRNQSKTMRDISGKLALYGTSRDIVNRKMSERDYEFARDMSDSLSASSGVSKDIADKIAPIAVKMSKYKGNKSVNQYHNEVLTEVIREIGGPDKYDPKEWAKISKLVSTMADYIHW